MGTLNPNELAQSKVSYFQVVGTGVDKKDIPKATQIFKQGKWSVHIEYIFSCQENTGSKINWKLESDNGFVVMQETFQEREQIHVNESVRS